MPRIIVSDTSCLILLSKIGELELLEKIYGQVTKTVKSEYKDDLPEWIISFESIFEFSLTIS